MKVLDILKIVEGEFISAKKKNFEIKAIKIDARKIKKNDLYLCIVGKNHNGHSFIESAVKNGAKAIITSEFIDKNYSVPIIKVDNTIAALERLAKYKRDKFNGIVIAVTGSVGKTTTKELLNHLLKEDYKIVCNEGNKNNIIGLSLTLLELKEDTEILITELGMNHLEEIKRLSNLCKPNIAVITNIGTSHIGNLGSKRNIFKAKLEIIDGISKGKLIVNGDDTYLNRIKKINNISIIKCGREKNNHFYCENITIYDDRSEFDILLDNEVHHFIFPIPGKHLINNVLLTINISLLLKVDIETIKKKVSNYQSYDRRLKIYKNNSIILIDDSYNSSFESLKASIETINKDSNKILIIGDVLELGKKSKKIHKKIGKIIKLPNTQVLLVGTETKVLANKHQHFDSNKALINYLNQLEVYNCTILVKGSNALKLNEVCDYLKKRFDMK